MEIDNSKKELISRYLKRAPLGRGIDPKVCVKATELKSLPADELLKQLANVRESPDLPSDFYPIVAALWEKGYLTFKHEFENRFTAHDFIEK